MRNLGPAPVIGLTGGPGVGKSLAAEYLKEKGALIVSGDDAGRRVVETMPSILKKLVRVFDESILSQDGSLDRTSVGRMVFGDPEAMSKFNAIIHPPLLRILKSDIKRMKSVSSRSIIIVDAALIFEWRIADWFDYILVLTAKRELRIRRMMKNGLSRREAQLRITSQIPQRRKVALADYVIENNGTRKELRRDIHRFIETLRLAKRSG